MHESLPVSARSSFSSFEAERVETSSDSRALLRVVELLITTYQEVNDPSRLDEHVAMTKSSGRVATPVCQSNIRWRIKGNREEYP